MSPISHFLCIPIKVEYPLSECLRQESMWISDLSGFYNNYINIMTPASSCFFHCYPYGCLLASIKCTHNRADNKTVTLYMHCMWEWAKNLLVFTLQKAFLKYCTNMHVFKIVQISDSWIRCTLPVFPTSYFLHRIYITLSLSITCFN